MKFFASKKFQRISNYALAAMLVVSTLTASVPFIFSQRADAASMSICAGGCNAATVQAAIDSATPGDTLSLSGNVTVENQITINKPLTLNGNGFVMSPTFSKPVPANGQNNATLGIEGTTGVIVNNLTVNGTGGTNLHGINAFKATASLNDVTLTNNTRYGLVVNGSNITVSGIKTSANAWGGVNVDQASTSNTATLTINGVSNHTESNQVFAEHISTGAVSVVDTNSQYIATPIASINAISYTLKVQVAAPTNLLPANNSFTNNPSFDNSWDAVPGAVKYEYTTTYVYAGNNETYTDTSDAGNYVLGGSRIIRHNNGAPEATYSWKVRGIDGNGTPGQWSATQNVTVDTSLPTVSITSPTVNQLVGGTTLTIEGTATDAKAFNYYYCYVTLPGSSEVGTRSTACNTTFGSSNGGVLGTVDLSGLANGNYEAHLIGYDKAGNHSDLNYAVPFKLDSSKPVIYVKAGGANVLPSSLASNTFKTVSFKVYDNLKVDKVTINGVVKDLTDAQWSDVNGVTKGVFGAVEGANTIVLFDTAGNTTSYDFIIDTIAPEAPVVSATGITASGDSTNQPSVTVNWNTPAGAVKYDYRVWTNISDDPYNGVGNAYYANGLTSNSRGGAFTQGQGTYFIQVRAIDAAGNISDWSNTFTVVYDATAPTVTITSPVSGATFGNGSQVTIEGSTGDSASYTLSIGNTGQTPLATANGTAFTSYIWDTSAVASGSYIVTLTAVDAAGNSETKEIVITIDNTAPTIVVAPQTNTTGNQPTITGTVNDANATLVATFNGRTYSVVNNAGTFSFTAPEALSNGIYTFSLRATDPNGNVSTQTADVVVAVVPPATTPSTTVTPAINGPSAVLGATTEQAAATDSGTGVKGATNEKTLAAAANSEANKGTIFGLAWFWWILILAALAAIAWFIIAAIRRRNEEQA